MSASTIGEGVCKQARFGADFRLDESDCGLGHLQQGCLRTKEMDSFGLGQENCCSRIHGSVGVQIFCNVPRRSVCPRAKQDKSWARNNRALRDIWPEEMVR